MRTTLTLDDDVADALKAVMRASGKSFKQVVNDALRRGLAPGGKPASRPARFRVQTFSSPFQPGVDPARLNQLLDDLDCDDFLAKQSRDERPK